MIPTWPARCLLLARLPKCKAIEECPPRANTTHTRNCACLGLDIAPNQMMTDYMTDYMRRG